MYSIKAGWDSFVPWSKSLYWIKYNRNASIIIKSFYLNTEVVSFVIDQESKFESSEGRKPAKTLVEMRGIPVKEVDEKNLWNIFGLQFADITVKLLVPHLEDYSVLFKLVLFIER